MEGNSSTAWAWTQLDLEAVLPQFGLQMQAQPANTSMAKTPAENPAQQCLDSPSVGAMSECVVLSPKVVVICYRATENLTYVASTVAELLFTVYWLEHVCNMCDFKPLYVWHHTYSVWYHNHFTDIKRLYSWHHTPCIKHCTHCIFVITTSPLISHPLFNDITPSFCVTSYALYRTSFKPQQLDYI